jgi:peptidoglycan/LPS O-acetylase OafA/YrhL
MQQKQPPLRLHFLDGLRGLASLYVLLFHEVTIKLDGHGELSPGMRWLSALLGEGHFAVVFFIVLSGFSLMLPVARSGTGELVGGFGRYIYRRARRILPPYYAALAISLALIVAFNTLGQRFVKGPTLDAALQPGSVISHLFLFHNLSFDWAYRINGPMWSVATEWQIYFIFALALLPLFRGFRAHGALVTIALGFLVGSLPFFLLPPAANYWWACPWFIGSFALGMWGALIGFAPQYVGSFLRERARWALFALVAFAVVIAICAFGKVEAPVHPLIDLVVSLFAIFWINALVQQSRRRSAEPGQPAQPGLIARFLGSKALVYLGGFSYSLYLVQHPVLRFTEKVFGRFAISADALVAIHLLLVTPLAVAVAWLFSEFFERPFTTGGTILPALRRRLHPEAPNTPDHARTFSD